MIPQQVMQDWVDMAPTAFMVSLTTLSYREREVIRLRCGIGGDLYAYNLAEVGRILKVTRERVRQVELKAYRKMRLRMSITLNKCNPKERTETK